MRWNLAAIAQAVGGDLAGCDREVSGITTDTRADCAGKLFIALKGERFDAHDYLAEARKQGAAALLVSREGISDPELPTLRVADTRIALGALAAAWRARFALPVLAVTGSNGKTTTREMIATILKTAYGEAAVLTPRGNFNNDIGLPRTLLELEATHKAAVLELGMNHPGEIAALTRIARPTAALVTNAQRAHLEGLGDVDAVAREKGSLYAGLDAAGIALVNDDDPHAGTWRAVLRARNAKQRIIGFSLAAAQGEITAQGEPDDGERLTGTASLNGLETRLAIDFASGRLEIPLAVPGAHNARNALAAAAAAWALGIAPEGIAQGLAAFPGVRGRLQRLPGPRGATLIDDTYNANPDSARAAIAVLAACTGRKFLVLGDMGEVGDERAADICHAEIGNFARSMKIDDLCIMGMASRAAMRNFGSGRWFSEPESLVHALWNDLKPGDTVLVKGSRFMKMERVVQGLHVPHTGGSD
ncbi:MAG: UDP-N-acetylmuramoyl-tripeptide--D-alanyl-D-alanine ligase [Zoogloeaceae bacterium]|jgi:UDP-N-acetylmuramoyl-tripeptide--D-alanyl-D-alanine ligase|nr:UDP-N-acetylmuramoyl-tripeptide--D-alanyl-D-alanine ligase [Zoogloeaceae bacterium]